MLFLFFPFILCGEEFEASSVKVLDTQENHFLTSTDFQITPKVNPVTGEYTEESCDLVIAGCQPLSLRRFYNHLAPHDSRYGGWRYNPESFLAANFEWEPKDLFACVGEANGSIISFKQDPSSFSHYQFEVTPEFSYFSTGQTHPLNTHITFTKAWDPKDSRRFEYRGIIKDGSGRERIFKSPMHRWVDCVHYKEKKSSFLGYSEDVYRVTTNVWTPFQVPIEEERLPNGNIVVYQFDKWQEEKENFPRPRLLKKITAYNKDKTKTLGSLTFYYPHSKPKKDKISGIHVVGSDGRKVILGQTDEPRSLTAVRGGPPQYLLLI